MAPAHSISMTGSSPRERGAPPGRHAPGHARRLIPAWRGAPLTLTALLPMSRLIPARAGRTRTPPPRDPRGLIPARAGSTRRTGRCDRPAGAHPRASGEHRWSWSISQSSRGSSPRERGAPQREGAVDVVVRLIPARAGSTLATCTGEPAVPAHPRASGEHAVAPAHSISMTGSSPRERGARQSGQEQGRGDGLIPARAGSTRTWRGRPAARPAHPRASGEHSV